MSETYNYKLGFQDQLEELQDIRLVCEGAYPKWLEGSYIVNGAAQSKIKSAGYKHWFDGLAMLKKFSFKDGKIHYSNQFLRSNDYLENNSKDTISHTTFGTNPTSVFTHIWEKFLAMAGNLPSDNTSVTVHKFGDDYVTLTELSKILRFDPKDLSTLGYYEFANQLKMTLSTAHPHFDFKRNKIYNLAVNLGLPSNYIFYEIDPKTKKRKTLCKVATMLPSYSHSFAMTEDFLILSELSMKVNPVKLLFTAKPVSHVIEYDQKNPVKFHIIDKNSGQVVKVFESNPVFGFHFANAYQDGNEIILDLISGENQNIFKDLTYEKINQPQYFNGKTDTNFQRLNLSLKTGNVSSEIVFPDIFEFPIINYARNSGKSYRYTYGTNTQGLNLVGLIKADLDKQQVLKWNEVDCFAGEPFFVVRPSSDIEDDGVVLSVVLDGSKKQSFLLILNAHDFSEIARAYVPHIIPYNFHGQFFRH